MPPAARGLISSTTLIADGCRHEAMRWRLCPCPRGKPYGSPQARSRSVRRTSGHATAAAGQAVTTKTYFSFRVDVWDDLRNDRAEGVSVIRIARQRCGK
jgi:hypothetical protein